MIKNISIKNFTKIINFGPKNCPVGRNGLKFVDFYVHIYILYFIFVRSTFHDFILHFCSFDIS